MVDHRWTDAPGAAEAGALQRSIAELRLGRWDDVRPRLLARLVHHRRAGPLAIEPPAAPWPEPVSSRLDVGIDVAGGIVGLDRELIRSLAVDPGEIWRAALDNLVALPGLNPPAALAVPAGPVSFTVVAGGSWTTGLLLVPEQLDRVITAAQEPGSPTRRRQRQAGPEPATVVVAPHPEVLVIGRGEAGADGRGGHDPNAVAKATHTLAASLARADGGPRLPLDPLRPVGSIQEVLSRAGGFWNDVPVSEQPGLR